MKLPDQPLSFNNHLEWRAWLEIHHGNEKEAWLSIRKNDSIMPGICYEEAVEEAVCFGWIDGVMKSTDAESYLLRFSPRKRRSNWSISNQKRVEKLTAEGRMTDAGLAKVKEAIENGEWEAALQREDTTNLPSDLEEALGLNPTAQLNFTNLAPSQRKQFIYWITTARTQKTRQDRIRKTVDLAENKMSFGSR